MRVEERQCDREQQSTLKNYSFGGIDNITEVATGNERMSSYLFTRSAVEASDVHKAAIYSSRFLTKSGDGCST